MEQMGVRLQDSTARIRQTDEQDVREEGRAVGRPIDKATNQAALVRRAGG